jgi:hypothetical protein
VTRVELAEWLLAQGRDADAREPLSQARETFEELRATPWVHRAAHGAAATMAPAALPA